MVASFNIASATNTVAAGLAATVVVTAAAVVVVTATSVAAVLAAPAPAASTPAVSVAVTPATDVALADVAAATSAAKKNIKEVGPRPSPPSLASSRSSSMSRT